MTVAEAAPGYARRGWEVFPIVPGAKNPLTEHGCLDAVSDIAVVNYWWQTWPDANIGLACGAKSAIVVLDFDVKGGKLGLETLRILKNRFGLHTLTAGTPSGGVHLFFVYPGPELRNGVDVLPGMDIRTTGGYVLLAPSGVAGKPYSWTNLVPPATFPHLLLQELTQRYRPAVSTITPKWLPNRLQMIQRAQRYVAVVPPAIEGQKGDLATFKLACRLVRGFGLTDQEALVLMSAWNSGCRPHWSERELIAKIASARRNGKEALGGRRIR